MQQPNDAISAWFAGPKAENATWFSERLRQVVDDYYAWRRNYYPEDGVVVQSELRRQHEAFHDAFDDRLLELLGRLKGDVPFHSPRYVGHMLAEQTLPGIAGYFAAMLYNPNNVSADVAPVTVRLELEAGQMLGEMIGFPGGGWSHLCSGGTVANIEALWVARSVRYLPLVVSDMCRAAGLAPAPWGDSLEDAACLTPDEALGAFMTVWSEARLRHAGNAGPILRRAVRASGYHIATRGIGAVTRGRSPLLCVPETHHYCFEKALDVLGLGRSALVTIPVDENFRMRPDALEERLAAADRSGDLVFAVFGVAGSTEVGSVDPIDQIADIRVKRREAGKPSFWLHADGAYGAYLRTVTIPARAGLGEPLSTVRVHGKEHSLALRLPEHAECAALEAMSRCDSVTIDPHKLGYIPYPAGAVCFRNPQVKAIVRQEAPYIDEETGEPEDDIAADSIGLYVLEGSKPGAAAAAVWLSHRLIPLNASGFGVLMRETIRNAAELHALLEHYPHLAGGTDFRAVCLCPPGSNIVCYALRPQGAASLDQINALNRALYAHFSLKQGKRVYDQEFFVSRTSLSARHYAPATVGAFLNRLGVSVAEYEASGVFLLRSVLMNPWHSHAKQRGRYFISELVEALFASAAQIQPPRPKA